MEFYKSESQAYSYKYEGMKSACKDEKKKRLAAEQQLAAMQNMMRMSPMGMGMGMGMPMLYGQNMALMANNNNIGASAMSSSSSILEKVSVESVELPETLKNKFTLKY